MADVGLVGVGMPFREVPLERLVAVGGPVPHEGDQGPQPFGDDVDDLGADARTVRPAEGGGTAALYPWRAEALGVVRTVQGREAVDGVGDVPDAWTRVRRVEVMRPTASPLRTT